MTLQLLEPLLIKESPQKLPFSIRKLGGGYSVLGKTSGEFQRFSKCYICTFSTVRYSVTVRIGRFPIQNPVLRSTGLWDAALLRSSA